MKVSSADGNSMAIWQRLCFIFALERCRRGVLTKAYREWAKGSPFGVDSSGALQ